MAQKNEDVVLSFELSVQDVNIILSSLAKQPLEQVLSVWANIKQVAESQLANIDIKQSESEQPAEDE